MYVLVAPPCARARVAHAPPDSLLTGLPPVSRMLCELQAQPDVPQLTQAELEREHEINYDADDPNVPQNITRYDFKEKAYKSGNPKNIMAQIHMCVHFSMAGSLILRGGDEARRRVFQTSTRRRRKRAARSCRSRRRARSTTLRPSLLRSTSR